MEKILVPCDFSTPAAHAFQSAVTLFGNPPAEIHLLHVIELPVLHDPVLVPVMSFKEGLFGELEDKAKVQFDKLTKSTPPNTTVVTKVVFGPAARMILDYIKEHAIDLVVMGTRGASGIREVFVGSNTEKIVRQSSVPVLAVRKRVDKHEITDIVFPTALEAGYQEELVQQVKRLQSYFGAKLHVVWINTPSNFTADKITQQRLREFADRSMFSNYTINIFNDLYEESGIINFAHSVNAGLLAMGTHGRKGLAHFFTGSVTEDIVNHVDLPIWTCTMKNK
jgi:nucleotide-binding universal stress UspA family protein